jgi:hypothetical protein
MKPTPLTAPARSSRPHIHACPYRQADDLVRDLTPADEVIE